MFRDRLYNDIYKVDRRLRILVAAVGTFESERDKDNYVMQTASPIGPFMSGKFMVFRQSAFT